MDVGVLLEPEVRFEELVRVLDELGFEGRLHAIREWGKATQAKLFEAAKGKHPLTMDHFVPSGTAERTPVRHHGKNSLPLFNHFEKRFMKVAPSEESAESSIVGYNHQDMGVLTGPGYFTVRNGDDEGEIAIDYTKMPTQRADGWPAIIPNEARLGKLVYSGMVDHMRGICSTVSIGRAAKGGKMMDAWFVLVREDPQG